MAQILVPGVAQCVIQGTYGAQPWALVWHFAFDGNTNNWTQTEIQALADDVHSGWNSYATAVMSTQIRVTNIATTDIGSSAPTVGSNTALITGASPGGGLENSSICCLMRFLILARYKGGHPRTYLPWGTGSDLASESSWTGSFQTRSQSAIAGIMDTVRGNVPPRGSSQVSNVVPRYNYQIVNDPAHSKYLRQRTSLKAVNVVQSYLCNPTFGVQRRRLVA